MRKTTLLLFILALSFSSLAQPVFSTHTIPGFGMNQITETIAIDHNNWYVYTSTGKLLKTTTSGGSYAEVTTFPMGAGIRKFVRKDDTIIGVGTKIVKSIDLGNTWTTMTKPLPGGDFDHIVLMPGGKIWMVGSDNTYCRLYETNMNLVAYTMKYSITHSFGFPAPDLIRFPSSFSADTVYFITTGVGLHGGMDLIMNQTYNNGNDWSSHFLRIDSMYYELGDGHETSNYQLTYIKYHDANRANVFMASSHFVKNFVTTNGFTSPVFYDTSSSAKHDAHHVIGWINCGGHQYLVFDYHEDSSPGLWEMTTLGTGEVKLLGEYIFCPTTNLSHSGNTAVTGGSDMYVGTIDGLCGAPSKMYTPPTQQRTIVTPNPSSSVFHINYTAGKEWTWIVYDGVGRKIYSGDNTMEQIDLSGHSNGVYVLRITDGANVVTQRIVKL